ncbi:MAG: DNA mismatch repair endonuclease MutL [Clostridia bacterium]|nr:DNA mismatch repair endonuclease MutL [Clostridia bacterium]
MGNIVLLDDLTINQIAAGEVIERPANVVKELVENALDAGATSITVEIKNGGKTLIKVIDNGKGIEQEDIPNAIERHATSKIKHIEDLENSYSMGFRGEALASIVAISKLTIISKTEKDELGFRVVAEAGNIIEAESTGCKTGTTMIVENLFFNTPVRYKFLKQDAQEFKYIKEFVQKCAFANLNISFKLISDEKQVFQSTGNGSIRDLVYTVYGKEISDNLIDVDYEEEDIKVTGIIGNTLMARESRKDQIVFLNKRNIRSQILLNSADQAFKGGTGIGKFGFFILNLEMPASFYDVNVHPTKMEVRFKDEGKIYRVFYHAIKSSILTKDFLGNNEQELDKKDYVENEYKFLTNHFNNNSSNITRINTVSNTSSINNSSNEKDDKSDNPEQNSDYIKNNPNTNIFEENSKNERELINRVIERKVDYKYKGILFRTYIVIEVGDEIYLIDQHAAHERLLYEKIKANYKNNIKENSQMMLVPEVYDLTHKEIEFVQNNIEIFRNIGFDIEVFGENSVKISGIPDIDYRVNSKNVFLDALDEMLTNERSSSKDIEERFIATVACKAAVKANMDLTKEEVDSLIQNLLTLKNPYTCPHGRPTTIKFSKNELEKKLN